MLDFLALLAFVVVMLVVPWMMAPPSRPGVLSTGGEAESPGSRSLFTSRDERRLWLWAAAVLVAIYASLPATPELAAALRERNLLRVSGGLVGLGLGTVIVTRWLRTRPGWLELGAGLGIASVYAMVLIRMDTLEERTHLFEYGLVALLILKALHERRRNGGRVRAVPVAAWAVAALLGWLDEGIQSLLPNRVYDIIDVGFNALAALMAISASLFLGWVRERIARRKGA